MSTVRPTVFLVDDDADVLKALSRLLRAVGYDVRAFDLPHLFLDQYDPAVPGCVVLDLVMPGHDGLELQSMLAGSDAEPSVIFLTGRGDIPTSVRAMRAGAVDFLTKPVDQDDLLWAIAKAVKRDGEARRARDVRVFNEARLARLTGRERQVLDHVIAGRLNKQIAGDLGTAEKTIKVHRGRMMEKLGIRTIVDLVRFAERAGIQPRQGGNPQYCP